MKKILISTGGSGGHVIPATIIFDHLKKEFDVKIVSDLRGSEFIDKKKYCFTLIDVPKPQRSLLKIPLFLINLLTSIIRSILFLNKEKFNIVISTGGYMSFPICLVSLFFKTEIILFEPNQVLGRFNRIMIKYSKKIICYHENLKNFPQQYKYKIEKVDNLLKKEIYDFKINKKALGRQLNLLVLGGSQGALFFDDIIHYLLSELQTKYEINLQQQVFDKENFQKLDERYKQLKIKFNLFSFTNNLSNIINNSNFIITRCGASALSEISYFNIPFIAVPFPHSKDNHQFYNAKKYEEMNCCWLYEQNDEFKNKIVSLFNKLIKNDIEYKTKINNLQKFSYQNTWNNINVKLIGLINEH